MTNNEQTDGLKLEIITWDDPVKVNLNLNWMTKDDFLDFIKKEVYTVTAGFVIYEDDEIIGLVQSVGQDLVDGGFRLLKRNIIKRLPVGVFGDVDIDMGDNQPSWQGIELEGDTEVKQ